MESAALGRLQASRIAAGSSLLKTCGQKLAVNPSRHARCITGNHARHSQWTTFLKNIIAFKTTPPTVDVTRTTFRVLSVPMPN